MLGRIFIACTAGLLASLGLMAPSEAQTNDAAAAASVRVPMSAALATAEQHMQGKAVRAVFEAGKGARGVYEIEIATGAKVFDVRIDADKGTVISANEDRVDGDDDKEEVD